jgi:hypothetical protein
MKKTPPMSSIGISIGIPTGIPTAIVAGSLFTVRLVSFLSSTPPTFSWVVE